MGFFSKLAFWKHDRDDSAGLPGLGGNESLTDLNTPGMPGRDRTGLGEFKIPETAAPEFSRSQDFSSQDIAPPLGTPPPPVQQPMQPAQQHPQDVASKNMEIISSKLDYLRASLESINQRLTNLENIAKGDQEQKQRYKW